MLRARERLENMSNTRFRGASGWRWLWVTLLVILLDRLTKVLAVHKLTLYVPVRIFSFFNFTLAYNKGAAFNFLNEASGWQAWLFSSLAIIVSIGILIWLKKTSVFQRWVCIALSLIMGGALGNLWDRLQYGYVTDFIEFHVSDWRWPAFNIADSAICIGAAMILWDMIKKKNKI
jgi:signal peptidase II